MAVDHIIDILSPKPGIQRDGTEFDSDTCIDGQWCRFYRGRPKKIGGHLLIDPGTPEIIRNIYEVNQQNTVDVYLGRPSTLNITNVQLNGNAAPESDRTPANFVSNPNNIWAFDLFTDPAVTTVFALGNDPLATTNLSAVIVVTVPSTSNLNNEQFVTIAGATDTGGIVALNLNITASITVLSLTTFSYTANAAATGTAVGGGAVVTYSTTVPVSYIIAHAAPNAFDINSSVEGLIYIGDISSSSALTEISPTTHQKSSGGIVVLYPYVFKYGNDGVVGFTLTPKTTWTNFAAITGNKIIKGLRTRGGGNAPAGLFWTLNSLIRATFIGGDSVFQFDTIQDDISVMSQNCIVTYNNIFFWIGVDQFYVYNGVVQRLENDTNGNTFFENINTTYRNKVWGMVKPRFHEIWWYYPKGNNTECSDIIIYNYKDNNWYDSVHARSAGFSPGFFPKPLECDSKSILNQFSPLSTVSVALGNNPLATTNLSAVIVVTVPSTSALSNGNLITITGATGFANITAPELNITASILVLSPTTFSYTSTGTANATTTGGGAGISYSYQIPNMCYGLWQEETGTDRVLFNQSLAIQSYFETNINTYFEKAPTDDRQLRVRRIEPDYVQSGVMNLVINTRAFAQSIITSSNPYPFLPGQEVVELAKIDTTNMGRLVSFRFESNVEGGNYEMGKVVLNYAPGDVRP